MEEMISPCCLNLGSLVERFAMQTYDCFVSNMERSAEVFNQ